MNDYRLSHAELAELRAAHHRVREIGEAHRINAVILLGPGRWARDVADALLLDPETVRSDFKRHKKGGLDDLLRMSDIGSEDLLDSTQLRALDARLQSTVYPTAADVARYVEQTWGVRYTPSGMTALLHRLG
ncbi:winged helix-turn-helix domain-containing protein [Thiorhodococcus minor]|uniref:Winged helix-turn-helix domain-containing protein n=1 Tax=Thiorhodococcus minor TaxID=57489 RepID=A0A6M0JSD6_9GAMM|nr:winged helix-turn-helix domain-containing protein [Thiorhodococcus minor]NEV60430.1 winged helix-turn-helix domain-containing protein [Thiorhodococcus minor]